MISVVKYEQEHKSLWDEFISRSKNGVFLFYRDYMEYHSDRFTDFSVLFLDDGRLIAVMPANISEGVLHSHGGLTFGGVVSDRRTKAPMMLRIFEALVNHLKRQGIRRIVYKSVPYIYHDMPAEEDLYALFRNNAKLVRRDISSTIFMNERKVLTKGRKWSIKKSRKNGLEVEQSNDFDAFMTIEEDLLARKYRVRPTHTADELKLLAARFPDNIKLFSAHKANVMLGGVVMYESTNVAHTQYIAANDEGESLGATDLVLDYLIRDVYSGKRYFDFGISTQDNGLYLNEGLIKYKESFGARAVVHDFYQMNI